MKKVIDETVAELIIVMKNGDRVILFHSWNDIIITEKGIELIPNSPNWEFNWESVDKIIVINCNSENYLMSGNHFGE